MVAELRYGCMWPICDCHQSCPSLPPSPPYPATPSSPATSVLPRVVRLVRADVPPQGGGNVPEEFDTPSGAISHPEPSSHAQKSGHGWTQFILVRPLVLPLLPLDSPLQVKWWASCATASYSSALKMAAQHPKRNYFTTAEEICFTLINQPKWSISVFFIVAKWPQNHTVVAKGPHRKEWKHEMGASCLCFHCGWNVLF